MKKKAVRAERAQPGLHLVVDVQPGHLEILRSAEVANAARRALQAPFLDASRSYAFATPVSEMVLDLLDVKGRVVESFGWPWAAEAFFERPSPKVRGGLGGGRVASPHTLRVLLVPVRTTAAFLLFYRTHVMPVEPGIAATPRSVTRLGLALYTLVSPTPPTPRLPFDAGLLQALPLPGSTPLLKSR